MTREEICKMLSAHLSRCEFILALWEGGSTAFGRTDEYSDLDLALLYKLGTAQKVWAVIDRAFDELGGVSARWLDPRRFPTGWGKRTFKPQKAKRWLQVDFSIIPDIAKELFNRPERDGCVVILFDHTARLVSRFGTNEPIVSVLESRSTRI